MDDTNIYYYTADNILYAYDFNSEKVAKIKDLHSYNEEYLPKMKKKLFINKTKICINPHIIFSRFSKFNILYSKLLWGSSLITPILLLILLMSQNISEVNFKFGLSRIGLLILFVSMLIVSNIIHEFSHAIVGCQKGLITLECGIKMIQVRGYYFPKFYTISVGYGKLNKVEKNKYLLAGILSNILLININCLLIIVKINNGINNYFLMMMIINALIVLGNMNVISNSDFYFLLENKFDCYGLREELIKFLKSKKSMIPTTSFKIFMSLFVINICIILVLIVMTILLILN